VLKASSSQVGEVLLGYGVEIRHMAKDIRLNDGVGILLGKGRQPRQCLLEPLMLCFSRFQFSHPLAQLG
jgi:hypothetical protein